MKKISIKILSIFIIFILIFLTFAACNSPYICKIKHSFSNDEAITPIYPIDCEVKLHTASQLMFLHGDRIPFGIKGKKELGIPKPVIFEWEYTEDTDDTIYTLNISEDKDMSTQISYTIYENKIEIYNLKIACTYYWTISTDNHTSDVCKFTTESNPPRNLHVDGITNVRDIGGWLTQDGKRTNQGLLFRCARLNSNVEEGNKTLISESGAEALLYGFGIKTEIDLRRIENGENGGITASPLGNSIKYYSCPMISKGGNIIDNKEQIITLFSILADRSNYPIILHCTIGTDRTGMISFLLNALLGVSEEDLYRDYLFSNYGNIGGGRKIKNLKESAYYQAVLNEQGNSLSEKTYNFLLSFGVTEEQLNEIINIFTK